MAKLYKYIVVGGGNASGYTAREFVKKGGGKGELCIISSEPYVAYERPALSKAYLFPEGFARLPGFHTTVGGGGERQEPQWYADKGIDYLTSTTVTALDVKAKTVTTNGGDTFNYEKLVLAMGARPINLATFGTPGAELRGIEYLRDVVDADRLLEAVKEAKAAGGKAVVVGGGYIGMEVAAGLSMWGLDVTMVFPESRLMERFFTPEIAAFYEEVYAGKGIKMVKGELCSGFTGAEGKVASVQLKGGSSLPADVVVVGVGATPNIELAKGQVQLLESRPGGVQVNQHLQTSEPDVFAVGDLAAFPLKMYDNLVTRQEHVQNCRLSAAYAMTAAMDGTAGLSGYDYLPFFYSRVFDLSWQFYGTAEGAEASVFFGDKAARKFGTYFVAGGKVVGCFLEGGSAEEFAAIKKVAAERPPAPEATALAAQGLEFASKL